MGRIGSMGQLFTQAINLGMVVTPALMIWKALMCTTGSELPVVVVLSGSMEPGFKRGDILFLHASKDPIHAGEIIVFNVDGEDISIVHRVVKVHERKDTAKLDVLTKRIAYYHDQLWLQERHIMGRAVGGIFVKVSHKKIQYKKSREYLGTNKGSGTLAQSGI